MYEVKRAPTRLSGPSFCLKILVKKVHNFKTIAFKVMALVLQQHLVMMGKYSVDTFNSFCVRCYIKVFA